MLNITTPADLIDFLNKLQGPMVAVLKTKTEVKMNKKDVETKSIENPYAKIFKIQDVEVQINADYTAAVNNGRLMEGKEQDFEVSRAKWGTPLSNTVSQNAEQLYVKVIENKKVGSPTYITEDGEIVSEDKIKPFMPVRKGATGQDLEDQVKVKAFKLENIREMTIGSKVKYTA